MPFYLKKESDGTVTAMADLRTVDVYGGTYDLEVPDDVWEAGRCYARLDADGNIFIGPTQEELEAEWIAAIREERKLRLKKCDKMNPMWWAALTEEKQKEWCEFRQALLDIPQQEGFPWGGDISKAPWPERPED